MRMKSRKNPEINSSSMADIAFLLLIFFLVTTTIMNDKGIFIQLPPKTVEDQLPVHERNLFKIQLNSSDQLLVNNEVSFDLDKMKSNIKLFVLNYDKDKALSESPKKAVVSIKTNRGTSYERFITVLNTVQSAYYDIYASNLKISNEAYRSLDYSNPEERVLIQKAKRGIPMNISIAEPSN